MDKGCEAKDMTKDIYREGQDMHLRGQTSPLKQRKEQDILQRKEYVHLRGQTSPPKAADASVLDGGLAGVVVLHRQPLPSVWVEIPRNLPHPSLPPHPTLQYPSLPPNHLTSFINILSLSNCFSVPPHSHWDVIAEIRPNQSSKYQ